MKILFLLSFLVASSFAALVIQREEYLQHTLFRNSRDREPKCDDCCDNPVRRHVVLELFSKWCLYTPRLSTFFPRSCLFLEFQVDLKDDIKIKFFGVQYGKFWPCSNGLISFSGKVSASDARCMRYKSTAYAQLYRQMTDPEFV